MINNSILLKYLSWKRIYNIKTDFKNIYLKEEYVKYGYKIDLKYHYYMICNEENEITLMPKRRSAFPVVFVEKNNLNILTVVFDFRLLSFVSLAFCVIVLTDILSSELLISVLCLYFIFGVMLVLAWINEVKVADRIDKFLSEYERSATHREIHTPQRGCVSRF